MFNFFKPRQQVSQPKTLGQVGEGFAQELYKRNGYKIVGTNFYNTKGLRLGEVDFIATDKKKIVFVEVKTRKSEQGKYGSGVDSVNYYKQQKILKAVKIFLLQNPEFVEFQPQIDVCLVGLGDVDKQPEYVKIISNAVEDWN